ncbi:PIN domain-containing protein [Pseudanabaena mucicola]|uniref:PIN domain-containing protein n=1 Tax=Pseudanabaena mucicola TaxID=71190 RepID=UPI0025790ED2|nr:PIN domain-containing protein [Pseudanabaena mucicola]
MLTNYILVDYENIQNIDLTCIKDKNIYIKMFIGSKQNNIPTDLVIKSQKLGSQIEWIQINGNGKNALDFHIAFELGKLVGKETKSFFHIISKDTGYDPLISYMKSQKIFCKRSDDIVLLIEAIQTSLQSGLIPQSNPSSVNQSSTAKDKESQSKNKQINQYDLVIKKLTVVNKIKRPKSEESLKNHIKSQLGLKDLTSVVNKIYQQLISDKKISLDQSKKITYNF